ncbi:dynein regulatory complex protein 10-like [Chrysoperla carnea]|uniref:dynein regulatory complex protein 10-like n=1 Tax=Chrysoperla carnea TaxID=189513 RepID=UPI001D0742FD|nr:dynein regulatory complex protein 10-like [Chrysoperla carnea]
MNVSSLQLSSFSQQSVHTFGNDVDDDFEDTETQRNNLQLEIERSRIIDIINESVNNISIALCLDNFIQNAEVFIVPYFNKEELKIIFKGFLDREMREMVETKGISVHYDDISINKQIEDKDLTPLNEALNIFCKNPNIINLARSNFFGSKCKSASTEYGIFTAFSEMCDFFIDRLNIRADEERRESDYLVAIWDKNEKAKMRIAELHNTLKEKQAKYERLKKEKGEYISTHEETIRNKTLRCQEEIIQNTTIAERHMADDWHVSVEKQRELKELCKQIRNEMETLVANHVYIEKQSRAKRLKIEMQLLSWVKKYDDEMGERQDRYDVLLKQFEDEKYLLEEMTKKFEEQEQIYIELMREKREYLHKIWLEKVSHFIRTIAARHIQRWYRRILKATAAKKKAAQRAAKKGKKGKSTKPESAVKSAPTAVAPIKDVAGTQPLSHEPSTDSRRTSMSSRRASTVPIGVTKIQTEPREMNVDENETEENQNGKKLPKFGYVSTFFKPPSEEEGNNSNGNVDSIDLF